MILNDPQGRPAATGVSGHTTIDDLFRRNVARRPEATALIDPPDRDRFTDGPPRQLTYAQADRMVSAIAGRLRRIGLHDDAIVGLQLANSVESVLALLAVLRAGLIAMPLPLLWRRAEAVTALDRVGVSALIVSGRIGRHDHLDLALQVATEVFPIRYVFSFGDRASDGVIPLDDLFAADEIDPIPVTPPERSLPPGPGAHVAVVTWEVGTEGPIPVGRSHAELMTAGLAVILEGRLKQDAAILNSLPLSSFGGLTIGLAPWLLTGGTLALHHPFDASTFVDQQRSMALDTALLPGPLLGPLAEAGCLPDAKASITRIIAAWRGPDRLSRAPVWRNADMDLIDVLVFGEIGLIPARRGPDGRPGPTPVGALAVPRGTNGGVIIAEVQPTAAGTVALRGPMVPRCPFPPGVERTELPQLRIADNGFIDTGYACRVERDGAALVVSAPPPGVINIGGYRFVMRDIQTLIADIGANVTLAALPDTVTGYRLAGSAPDRAAVQERLVECGASPLLIGAFRNRRPAAARPSQDPEQALSFTSR